MLALMRKHFSALRPCNADAEELLKKLKDGLEYSVEVKRPRNLKWHKKYWLACRIIAENMPDATKEAVSDYIKIQTGHVHTVKVRGEFYKFPKSISFASMDATEWEAFWERAVKVMCEELIAGLDSDELEKELFELLQ